jgi:hypothetical protein
VLEGAFELDGALLLLGLFARQLLELLLELLYSLLELLLYVA